jgi:Recombination endonuclease VII
MIVTCKTQTCITHFLKTGRYHVYCTECARARKVAHKSKRIVRYAIEKRYKAKKISEIGILGWNKLLAIKMLRRWYKLSPEGFQKLIEKQQGICACGKRLEWGKRRPHVDHDHACCPAGPTCGNCIRGILCFRCNIVLGLYKNEPSLLPEYLKGYLNKA